MSTREEAIGGGGDEATFPFGQLASPAFDFPPLSFLPPTSYDALLQPFPPTQVRPDTATAPQTQDAVGISDDARSGWLPVPAADFDSTRPAAPVHWPIMSRPAAAMVFEPSTTATTMNLNPREPGVTSTDYAASGSRRLQPTGVPAVVHESFEGFDGLLFPPSIPSSSPGSFAVPPPRPLSRRTVSSSTTAPFVTAPSFAQEQQFPSGPNPIPAPTQFTPSTVHHQRAQHGRPRSSLRHSTSAPSLALQHPQQPAPLDVDLAARAVFSPASFGSLSLISTPRTTPPSSASLTSSATFPTPIGLITGKRGSGGLTPLPLEPTPKEDDEEEDEGGGSEESGETIYEEEEDEESQEDQQRRDEKDSKGKEQATNTETPKRKRRRRNMFKCQLDPNCTAEFSRAEHLARHERKHTKEKPFICHCTKAFSRLDNWRQHKNSVHKDETEDNQRTEDRLMSVHKSIQRRNNANKQAYMSGETLAISAPPETAPSSSTSGGLDAVAPISAPAAPEPQPTFAGVHHQQPHLALSASPAHHAAQADYESPYSSPARYYASRAPPGSGYGYWRPTGDEAHYADASGSPSYGLAETSGRAYVAMSPTTASFSQSPQSAGPSSAGAYGGPYGVPVLSMPPAAFSPVSAADYAPLSQQSQYRPTPLSHRSSGNSSTASGRGSGSSPSPAAGRSIQLPPLSSSVSPPGGPDIEIARQEILRARALAAVLNKPIEEIEREAAYFAGGYDPQRLTSASQQLTQSLAMLSSSDALTTAGSDLAPQPAMVRSTPPSPLRQLNEPPATIGLPPQATYISTPGTPGSSDRWTSFHHTQQYAPFQTPPPPQHHSGGGGEPSYRLPTRPKSSNDMRSAVVLASAVAAHGGFNPTEMASTASSSSTLASSAPPSYSITPAPAHHHQHMHYPAFAASGPYGATGSIGLAPGPSSTPVGSVPPSPVVSYLMPPFHQQAGPRHLESPNLPSTPRMDSASSVATVATRTGGGVVVPAHSPLIGTPVGGSGSVLGSAATTPVIGGVPAVEMIGAPGVERVGSPGKRRREDEVEPPRMSVPKPRITY